MKPQGYSRQALLWLAIVWAGSHLPIWLVSPGVGFDINCWERAASAINEGRCLYVEAEAIHWRYGPAWALVLALLQKLPLALPLSPAQAYKIPGMLADFGNAFLVFKMLERLAGPSEAPLFARRSFWAGLAAAAFPLPALISAGHGQFDSLAVFLVLSAVWFAEFSSEPRADIASALCLAFAIALKTWPGFFLPLFVRNLGSHAEKRRFMFLSLGIPLALLLPFLYQCGAPALLKHLRYGGATALSLPETLRASFFALEGTEAAYRIISQAWEQAAGGVLIGLFFTAWVLPRRLPLMPGLSLAVLTLYVFAPAFSVQYLLWLFPVALLLPWRLALWHGMAALAAALLFYLVHGPDALFSGGLGFKVNGKAFYGIWAVLNLALWVFFVVQWRRLMRFCFSFRGRMGVEP